MKWHWLSIVAQLTPVVLSLIPGAAPLAPIVAHAIHTSEGMPGATGAQKLAAAQQLVVDGAASINALHGSTIVPPDVAAQVAAEAISTIVDTTNMIHSAHAPAGV